MSGMASKGVHRRATDARSAANRLRWEIDLALGVWEKAHTPTGWDANEVSSAIPVIAESLGIFKNILDTIEERLPEQDRHGILTGDLHKRMAHYLEFYINYHKVGR